MKDRHKGAQLDLDRRSRESVPSRRSRMSGNWISLSGRLSVDTTPMSAERTRRSWLSPLSLALAAFRAGRLPLLRAAHSCRRNLFHEPVRLTHFLAIRYGAPPSSLQEELTWLRDLGVRQVVVPLDQDAVDLQQVKALGAIQNLSTENCRVAAVLRPKRGAMEEPDTWHQFCHWILSQVGWQLESAQLGDGLDAFVRERKDILACAKLFTHVPRLRRDYPGVALRAPGMERFEAVLSVQALQHLLPEGHAWDSVSVRAPAWQAMESVGLDGIFLRRLTLAGGVALQPGVVSGKVQVCFPPPPVGCDPAAAERIAGSVVRRAVLALCSGVANQVVIGMDPAMRMVERKVLSMAIRELVAQLEGARFERRLWVGDAHRDYVLEFSRTGKPPVLLGWTDGEPRLISVPFEIGAARDYLCRPVAMIPYPRVRLTRNMAYFEGT